MPSAERPSDGCPLNLNSADEGFVGDRSEDNVELSAAVGSGGELSDDRFVYGGRSNPRL